jgi:RNA polymerase sigma factor (TIGR02999 family)
MGAFPPPAPDPSGHEGAGEITQLLLGWREGDREAANRIFPLVYDELRRLARRRRAGAEATLDTTALVHEAYLKLVDCTRLKLADRRHFFAVAARAMRQIVIDLARERSAQKRGGQAVRVPLLDAQAATPAPIESLLALDLALDSLRQLEPRLAEVVEMRFFGGLSVEETAELLATSPRTVKRDWQRARAFLAHTLSGPAA